MECVTFLSFGCYYTFPSQRSKSLAAFCSFFVILQEITQKFDGPNIPGLVNMPKTIEAMAQSKFRGFAQL